MTMFEYNYSYSKDIYVAYAKYWRRFNRGLLAMRRVAKLDLSLNNLSVELSLFLRSLGQQNSKSRHWYQHFSHYDLKVLKI